MATLLDKLIFEDLSFLAPGPAIMQVKRAAMDGSIPVEIVVRGHSGQLYRFVFAGEGMDVDPFVGRADG